MPILETVAYLVVITWFMPATCNEIVSLAMRTDCWIRHMTRKNLNSTPDELIDYEPDEVNDIILNDSVRYVTSVLQTSNYGLLIIAAPAGSGKSTYLMKALQNLYPMRMMKVFRGGAYLQDTKKILSSFGIPDYAKLSTYLPRGSIIIIDQVDFTAAAFNYTIQANIADLATDSHNSKGYLVILCISDAQFALKALECNGGEKINLAVAPEKLKWTENEARAFLHLKNVPEDTMNSRLNLFINKPCYNPRIMRDYFNFKRTGGWTDNAFRNCSEMKNMRWNEFEENITPSVCGRYLVPVIIPLNTFQWQLDMLPFQSYATVRAMLFFFFYEKMECYMFVYFKMVN